MTKPPSVSDTITKRGPLKREAIDVRYNDGRKAIPHTTAAERLSSTSFIEFKE
jgi:hypothetical protein